MGYSGVMTAETAHDPFFPLLVAAQHTEKVELMTSIAVAFARSPMTLANRPRSECLFQGRFVLGLGSRSATLPAFFHALVQPAARMREYVMAMRAIWDSWHQQEPLAFTGSSIRIR